MPLEEPYCNVNILGQIFYLRKLNLHTLTQLSLNYVKHFFHELTHYFYAFGGPQSQPVPIGMAYCSICAFLTKFNYYLVRRLIRGLPLHCAYPSMNVSSGHLRVERALPPPSPTSTFTPH